MCQTWKDINTSGIHLESLQGLTINGRLVNLPSTVEPR